MKTKASKILLLAFCSLLLISIIAPVIEAAESPSQQIHSYLRQGIDKAFNLETASANTYIKKALELDPGNPAGYAYLAMLHLCSYQMSFEAKDKDTNQAALLHYFQETITKGEKRLEKNPQDSQAYFAMALAKIAKIQWAIQQKRYFVVAQETANIWEYLEKAKAGDPQNHDIYFLMGLLHYHLDHLSGFSRFLTSSLITSGDRQKGLQELELAAQKGGLLKELAQAELSSAYLNFEKQPAKALPIARDLNKRFPNNYNFSFALGNALSDLRRFEEAFAVARGIEKNIQAGASPFVPQLQPRYNQLMGRILFSQGEYDRSIEYFQNALKDTSFYNSRIRAWALVRMGMIQDIRQKRKQAEDYYSKALEVEGGEGAAQIEAQKHLKIPYATPAKL